MRDRAEGRLKWAVGMIAVAVLGAFTSACRAAPVTVSLREEAVVAAGPVTLGQLADIEAETEASPQIAAVIIGSSPLPGRERRISAGYVRMRMARAGVGSDTAKLGGASAVVVRVAAEKAVRPQVAATAEANGRRGTGPRPTTATTDGTGRRGTGPRPTTTTGEAWSCKRGQRVQIRVVCGSIVVITSGQLLENAAAWEPAIARVGSTGNRVCGVLSGPRELTVRL